MAMTGVEASPVPPLVDANTEHSYTVNGVKPLNMDTTRVSSFEEMTLNMMEDSLHSTV